MKTMEYYAKVLKDGHLSVPKNADLNPGDLVRVLLLSDEEDEGLALRDDFISEMKKAKEEDLSGEGVSLEDYEKIV